MLNQPKQFWSEVVSHVVMSLHSLTVCLAYFHYYTPSALAGRRLSPLHLRQLALWIGHPAPHLRSLRSHPILAAHLAILGSAKLLQLCDKLFTPSPSAITWLHLKPSEQLNSLLTTLKNGSQWEQTVSHFGLEDVLPLDYARFIQQTLERQLEVAGNVQPESSPGTVEQSRIIDEHLSWAEENSGHEVWSLWLPSTLPAWLLFDLLQLGTWQPGKPLCCTPVSLATAVQHGYSSHHIQWLLETGFGSPLPTHRVKQLAEWVQRTKTYQVQTVQLLRTRQTAQLKEILAQRKWRSYFQEQISPRHAIIHTSLVPHLQEWLAQKGYVLNGEAIDGFSQNQTDRSKDSLHPLPYNSTAYEWLGLEVLVKLGQLIPLSYPPPYAQLEAVEKTLDPLQKSELESLANTIIEQLRLAIRGQDAFWPPEAPISPSLLAQITQAIEQEQHLDILYLSLAEYKPSYRRIQPLRLVEQGGLYYLHAYCYRTENNLVFRVDRIHQLLVRS